MFVLVDDGVLVLFEVVGGGNFDCIFFLLEYGGSGNVFNRVGYFFIYRVVYEGYYL